VSAALTHDEASKLAHDAENVGSFQEQSLGAIL
jgi:hypothetical protein